MSSSNILYLIMPLEIENIDVNDDLNKNNYNNKINISTNDIIDSINDNIDYRNLLISENDNNNK
ncbi:hypothetical protein CHREV_134 [Choristoneura rosaceana entomopoxvirus 'L']|uniref:N1R/p28-like protein n=1 Tax=Choristoneura rosaceana entomopoxvirus 'L' TaxID=1293539 RepID=A0ABM9QKH9_9POXV|nr:hypothetical protein CHREV_134 [Choristoneura rosaceana entomopoxvirus 'L']CCU56036.1 hypothetical protein CHREV_134 [Choristoneura rosaceana entomopoxvirus 'L']